MLYPLAFCTCSTNFTAAVIFVENVGTTYEFLMLTDITKKPFIC